MECSKCHSNLRECGDCDGQTRKSVGGWNLTCSTCNSTGWLCPQHDGHWE